MEKDFQRWTARRKVELLLQLIKGDVQLVDVCREHDLKQSEVEGWLDAFLKAGERGLKARAEDEQALHDREVLELRAKVGELVLELDARKNWTPSPGNPRKPSDGAGPDARRRKGCVDRAALPVVRRAAVDVLLPAPGGAGAPLPGRRQAAGGPDPGHH
jgi:transposase-like protein